MSQMFAQMLSSIPHDTQVDRNLPCGSEGAKAERFLLNLSPLKAVFSLPENIIYVHHAIQVGHRNCISLHLGIDQILVSSILL